MAQYNIGQKRFQGSGCVTPDEHGSVGYKVIGVSADQNNPIGFKDAILTPSISLTKGQDYYLKISIPQDVNYNMSFNVKLVPSGTENASKYQFIKKISVNKGGKGENIHRVVLYEKSDRSVDVALDLNSADYNPSIPAELDKLYTDGKNFYIGTGLGDYNLTNKFNDVVLAASWKTELAQTYGVFEMIFRPVENNFTSILLEMERTPEDYNIQRTTETGETEYGRKIELDWAKNIVLYQLINQVPSGLPDTGLSRIGIWGHPNLLMAINGEEIHIGPSGYYEQDVVNITSVGIVAKDKDWASNWTMDYEYKTEGGE